MSWSGYPPRLGTVHWVLVFLASGVIALAAYLLLGACGVIGPGWTWGISGCPIAGSGRPDSRLAAAQDQQAFLEEKVAQLEMQLALLECEAPLPVARAEPEQEPGPPPPYGLDAEQWEEQDIEVLAGCWVLDSDYQTTNVRTGEISDVASWNMCFESDGRGNQTIMYDTGRSCRSGNTARFNDRGQLEISDNGNVMCSNGGYIYSRVMTCDLQQDGTASCLSRSSYGGELTPVVIRAR